jgi:chemotaxis protein MotA
MSFLIGLLLCCAALSVIVLFGGSPLILFDWKALVFVAAGIVGLSFIASPMSSLFKRFCWAARAMRRPKDPELLIDRIIELVNTARREGILALESKETEISDPILKKGLGLITGSAQRETIEKILKSDAEYESSMEKSSQDFIERIAVMSPGIGMLGTLVEIIQMLYTYKEPATLAPGIANALLPVLYAGIISYIILMPIVSRIKSGSQKHELQRQLSIDGVLAIQSGEPSYIVRQSLSRYIEKKTQNKETEEMS